LQARIKQRKDIELQLENALPREGERIYNIGRGEKRKGPGCKTSSTQG